MSCIRGLTHSNEEDNTQLIVHVKDDFDLILTCEKRLELVTQIIKSYHLDTKTDLAIYGLPGGLDFFMATRAPNALPAEKHRLTDQGLYT